MTQEPTPQEDASDEAPVTFEDALMRLADAVRQLEDGNLSLDESLARYESGIRHLSQCQKILTTAERKIELLSGFDAEGNPVTRSFDDEVTTLEEKADTRGKRRTANQSAKPARKRTKKAKSPTVASDDDESPNRVPTTPSRKRRPATRTSNTSNVVDESHSQDDVDSGGTLF